MRQQARPCQARPHVSVIIYYLHRALYCGLIFYLFPNIKKQNLERGCMFPYWDPRLIELGELKVSSFLFRSNSELPLG